MFVLGLDAYSSKNSYFDTLALSDNPYRIELKDGVFDAINMDNQLDIVYKTDKTEWTFTTLLLADFENNLEAGNVNLDNLDVSHIILKRRRKNDKEWQDYKVWESNPDIREYLYYDRYVSNCDEYEYATVPVSTTGLEGVYNFNSIRVKFNDYFLLDKDQTFRLEYEMKLENIVKPVHSSISYPLNGRYPIVTSNNELRYTQGEIHGTFYVEDMCEFIEDGFGNSCESKVKARDYQEAFDDFCRNGKPKILKDNNSNMWLCHIYEDNVVEYMEYSNNTLAEITIPFIEIGDKTNLETLRRNGLIDVLPK